MTGLWRPLEPVTAEVQKPPSQVQAAVVDDMLESLMEEMFNPSSVVSRTQATTRCWPTSRASTFDVFAWDTRTDLISPI